MEQVNIDKISEQLTNEQATELRKKLRGKSGYKKKGVYREKENKLRYFKPHEWELFISECTDRQAKWFWFLYLTGMRYKEAKNVKKQDIDWSNRTIIIFKPKGGVQRYANFSSYAKRKLRSYFEGLDNKHTLEFPSNQALVKTIKNNCKKLKLPYAEDFSVHNIRKSHENALLALDLNQSLITKHMGHTPKTASEHYNSSEVIKDKKQKEKIDKWFGDILGDKK